MTVRGLSTPTEHVGLYRTIGEALHRLSDEGILQLKDVKTIADSCSWNVRDGMLMEELCRYTPVQLFRRSRKLGWAIVAKHGGVFEALQCLLSLRERQRRDSLE